MSELSRASHYQPDIQGLRALAVILVIFYHSGLPGLPGGYIGVDVFFVISGYLITSLLLRELARNDAISLPRFYARRFRRLLPAATLVLIVTTLTAWFVYSPLALKQFSSSAFATAIYLSNIWFAHLSTDYLAEDTAANPLLHTWSLGVEEQFYLFWPLIMMIAYRVYRSRPAHQRLTVVFVALAAISFALEVWLTSYKQPWAFFGSPTRAWEFAAGGLLALGFARGALLSRTLATALGWLGFFLICAAAVLLDRSTPFPGTAALLPVLGASGLIAAAHTERRIGMSALLATRPLQLIGDLSYSLYLWHWPVFVFLAPASGEPDALHSLLLIALTFTLSWQTLVFVENPVRFNRRLSAKTIRSIGFGFALTATSASIALGIRAIAAGNLQEPLQRTFMAAKTDIPRIYGNGCHLDHFSVTPAECSFGKDDADTTVVLFGDSHAAHWFPALENLARHKGWRLVSMTKSGCPSVAIEPFNELLGRAYTECTAWHDRVIERIGQLQPKLVVLSNSGKYVDDRPAGGRQWQTGVDEMLSMLSAPERRVVIIKDVPRLDDSGPDCLSLAVWKSQDPDQRCRVPMTTPKESLTAQAERAAASSHQVQIIDMDNAVCPSQPCPVFADGRVKYTDEHHLSRTFSAYLAPQLEAALDRP